MTNYDERRIYSASSCWEGEPKGEPIPFPDLPICRPHHLPKDLARQEPHPPEDSPTKVGAQVFRNQLRTKVRSIIWFTFTKGENKPLRRNQCLRLCEPSGR
jgi:mannosyltransferase OCH1-like enzyme